MNKPLATLPLLAGLMLGSAAWADPQLSVTVTRSDNLSAWTLQGDGQLRTNQYWTNYQEGSRTTSSDETFLHRYQDAQGHWWDRWQINQYQEWDYTYDVYLQNSASIYLQQPSTGPGPAPAEGQWLHFDISSNLTLNYSFSISATDGSRITPRGNVQIIKPAFSAVADGVQSNGQMNWTWGSLSGSFQQTLSLDFEATDGAQLMSYAYLSLVDPNMVFDYLYQGHQKIGVGFTYVDRPVASVPEPGTWALMLAGLVGLVSLQRRRTRG